MRGVGSSKNMSEKPEHMALASLARCQERQKEKSRSPPHLLNLVLAPGEQINSLRIRRSKTMYFPLHSTPPSNSHAANFENKFSARPAQPVWHAAARNDTLLCYLRTGPLLDYSSKIDIDIDIDTFLVYKGKTDFALRLLLILDTLLESLLYCKQEQQQNSDSSSTHAPNATNQTPPPPPSPRPQTSFIGDYIPNFFINAFPRSPCTRCTPARSSRC